MFRVLVASSVISASVQCTGGLKFSKHNATTEEDGGLASAAMTAATVNVACAYVDGLASIPVKENGKLCTKQKGEIDILTRNVKHNEYWNKLIDVQQGFVEPGIKIGAAVAKTIALLSQPEAQKALISLIFDRIDGIADAAQAATKAAFLKAIMLKILKPSVEDVVGLGDDAADSVNPASQITCEGWLEIIGDLGALCAKVSNERYAAYGSQYADSLTTTAPPGAR